MKSIAQMAKDLDISSSTVREYLSRFEEFFPDPVEREGVKEYPPETEELLKKIYGYYQNSGMTKEEIRIKLGGPASAPASETVPAPAAAMSPVDMEIFAQFSDRMERLIESLETLTAAITGASVESFKSIRRAVGGDHKINEINAQLTDIIESTKDEGQNMDEVEKNVLNADGTVVFSYGKLTASAADSMNFAKAHKKPWLHIDLETEKNPAKVLRAWLPKFDIKVLNVAGKSASKIPGLKRSIDDMIALVFSS